MKKPRTLRAFPFILALCTGLFLAACGDNTPTGSGGKSVQLVAGDYVPPALSAHWRGPLWASNNTALVRRQSDLQLVLLQITTK